MADADANAVADAAPVQAGADIDLALVKRAVDASYGFTRKMTILEAVHHTTEAVGDAQPWSGLLAYLQVPIKHRAKPLAPIAFRVTQAEVDRVGAPGGVGAPGVAGSTGAARPQPQAQPVPVQSPPSSRW
jgi:hypothetical protein